MSIEFRNVSLAPLAGFRAVAPSGVIIGVIGEKQSGVSELLKLAAGLVQPEPAEVVALDQALATQDALVRVRTLTGLDRLRRAGTTVLLASHEGGLLESLCDEVWWIEGGQLAAKGDPAETLAKYRRHIAERVRSWGETIPLRIAPSFRRGNGRAEVISIESLG